MIRSLRLGALSLGALSLGALSLGALSLGALSGRAAAEPPPSRKMSPLATPAELQASHFKADPVYPKRAYDAQAQRDIYGNKRAVNTARPLLEVGRPLYSPGELSPGAPLSLVVFGDVQSAVGVNAGVDGATQALLGLRASLDVDLRLTSTERLHALVRPLDTANQPSQLLLSGPAGEERGLVHIFQRCVDSAIDPDGCTGLEAFDELFANLFFEGEFGGLPVALGKMPHLLQNGVWLEDAYVGGALSIAARNSAAFDISNYDVAFFGAAVGVDDRVFGGAGRNGGGASLAGVSFFIEALGGYIEGGYGYVLDREAGVDREVFSQDPALAGARFKGDLSYHNATVSFTRRYGALLSSSARLVVNAGQEESAVTGAPGAPGAPERLRTANGAALLLETSLITRRPLTLVPYLNLFAGLDSPQALAKQFGLLRNTGLLFEDNALTAQRSLFDNPDDSVGGALGLEYLFNLDQQVAVEVAGSASVCRDAEGANLLGARCRRGGAQGVRVRDQAGVGFRYQLPFGILKKAWILRADGALGVLSPDEGAAQTFYGARLELRRKF
ncbi:MAG: hypothetical protein FJ138_02780 [Deltaproteobacteria bacterium]|nr:hypothetical protein [Deltaproteobacteria bacterium]